MKTSFFLSRHHRLEREREKERERRNENENENENERRGGSKEAQQRNTNRLTALPSNLTREEREEIGFSNDPSAFWLTRTQKSVGGRDRRTDVWPPKSVGGRDRRTDGSRNLWLSRKKERERERERENERRKIARSPNLNPLCPV